MCIYIYVLESTGALSRALDSPISGIGVAITAVAKISCAAFYTVRHLAVIMQALCLQGGGKKKKAHSQDVIPLTGT